MGSLHARQRELSAAIAARVPREAVVEPPAIIMDPLEVFEDLALFNALRSEFDALSLASADGGSSGARLADEVTFVL